MQKGSGDTIKKLLPSRGVIPTSLLLAAGQIGAAPQLEEIVVTAQLREESLQDVAMSITAIDSKTLAALGASNFSDYARTVPGLSFVDAGPAGGRGNAGGTQRQIAIRGISSDTGSDVVGFYLNDTPITFSDPRLFDVERVEILRGPQGTLYGNGSVGGTVRIITKRPNFEEAEGTFSGYVSTTKNGDLNYGSHVAGNLPLGTNIGLRYAAYYEDESGFIDNSFTGANKINDSDTTGFTLDFLWQPTDNLEVSPLFWYQDTTAGAAPTFTGAVGDLKVPLQTDNSQKEEMLFSSFTLKYQLPSMEITSSTSYYDLDTFVVDDFSGFLQGLFGLPTSVTGTIENSVPTEQFAQELRLASTTSSNLSWILGAFYSDRQSNFDQFFIAPGFDEATGIPVNDLMFEGVASLEEEQLALFGEIAYTFAERWTATVGLRYFKSDKTDARTQRGLFIGAPVVPEVSGVTEASDSGLAPKISLAYDISDTKTVYATAARGFRPGGPVRQIPVFLCAEELERFGFDPNNPPSTYEADELWSYELGAKTSWLDNRMAVNGAAYHIEWDKAQQTVNLACLFPFTYNTSSATSTGFELEFNYAVSEGLTIDSSISYTDAELSEDAVNLNAVEGESLLFVSDWNASLGIDYIMTLRAGLDLSFRLDWQYVGDRFDNYAANTLAAGLPNRLDAYDVTNARVRVGGEAWRLSLFAENLSDERAQYNRPVIPNFDPTNVGVNRPRTLGVRFTMDF